MAKHPQLPQSMRRRRKEKDHQHRGFLLYAMQADEARSVRAVARACEKSESAVRGWSKTYDWAERVNAVGKAAQTYAARFYRVVWMGRFGAREIVVVEKNMEVSIHAAEPPPVQAVGKLTEPEHPASDRAPTTGDRAEAAHQIDDDATRRTTRRHLSLLDALIKKGAQSVVKGDLKISSIGDLVRALKVRGELSELLGDIVPPAAVQMGPSVEETYRVRQALREGGDIIEARLHDAQEAVALLQGMQAAKGVADALVDADTESDEASAK